MKHKPLWTISVTTTPEAEDAVAELLSAVLNLPASAYFDIETAVSTVTVYLQQKLHLPRKIRVEISAALGRIESCGLKIGPGKIVIAKVRRENWAESWKRHFKPIEIGDALLIKPSWSKRKAREGQAEIVLDPGLSFGTGHHPTTAFCIGEIVRYQDVRDSTPHCPDGSAETVSKLSVDLLSPRGTSGERNEERGISNTKAPPRPGPLLHFMEEREKNAAFFSFETVSASHPSLKSPSFLDLGTGSGILAMAAAKLGFSPVFAMDFDPEAVRVARTNARVNRVRQKLTIRRGDVAKLPFRPRRQYDLICANLISTLLITVRRRIAAQLNPAGTLVLAGILKSEFREVEKAYKTLGLRLVSHRDEKEWRSGSFRFGS
jgi:ribosomal protein L11 methylase PrmA